MDGQREQASRELVERLANEVATLGKAVAELAKPTAEFSDLRDVHGDLQYVAELLRTEMRYLGAIVKMQEKAKARGL
jgi:hypothetical protein